MKSMQCRPLYAVLVAIVPLAIGCQPLDQQDARAMFGSIESGLAGGQAGGQALSIDAEFDVECRYGGSALFDGSFDADAVDGAAVAQFAYEVTFDKCANDDNTIDGIVNYVSRLGAEVSDSMASVDFVYTYQGSLVTQGESNGTCDFDVRGAISSASAFGDGSFSNETEVLYTGTICGHDAEDVLDDRYESRLTRSSSVNVDFNP